MQAARAPCAVVPVVMVSIQTLLRNVLLIVLLGLLCGAVAGAEPGRAEVEALIAEIEDPQARARLVARLELLLAAQDEAQPAPPAAGAVAVLLQQVSGRLERFTAALMAVAGMVREMPQLAGWVNTQLTDAQARARWTEILGRLVLILGAAYGIGYLVRLGTARVRRALVRTGARTTLPERVLQLVGALLLDLVPIAVLAGIGYGAAALLTLRPETRLVALAWVNAGVIVWTALAATRFLLAPATPALRLLPLQDETAVYCDIWVRRFVFVAVYGFFALQTAVLLGLAVPAYAGLMRLFGLFITGLFIVFVLQTRSEVGAWIRGLGTRRTPSRPALGALCERLAVAWPVIAIAYALVLYGVWALEVRDGFLFIVEATVLSLLVIAVVRLVLRGIDAAFARGFRVSAELVNRFPTLEQRANRYLVGLRGTIKVALYLLGVLAFLQAWGLRSFAWLASDSGQALGGTIMTVALIVFLAMVVWEVSSSIIETVLARDADGDGVQDLSPRTRTLLDVARNALLVVLSVVVTLTVLAELGINIGPLLAGAGVVGLAVGFGAQTLVKDIITGAFILLENLFEVGDVIQVGDKAGLVESVTIRRVRLRDLSGTVHTIPFSGISTVSNLTRDFSYYVFDVGVAYREDVDEVMRVLVELGAELQADPEFGPLVIDPMEILGVDAFADSAVIVKARIKTLPIKQWTIGREFNRRMKKRFDELGIEIPFPHRTIYFGEDKAGHAPPLQVRGLGAPAVEPDPHSGQYPDEDLQTGRAAT